MAEDTETTEETTGNRSQMWKHEDIYEWLQEEGHIDGDSSGPEIIAAFAARRNEYRKTERYATLVEQHAAEAEEAKAARAAAREEAKAAREAEKAEKEKAKEEAKAKAEGEKPAAKKATTSRRRSTKAKDSDEDPFD